MRDITCLEAELIDKVMTAIEFELKNLRKVLERAAMTPAQENRLAHLKEVFV